MKERQNKHNNDNEPRKVPGWMQVGRVGLATTLLLVGGHEAKAYLDDRAYEKAAVEAIEIFNNLSTDDFLRCQPLAAKVGPSIRTVTSRGIEESASISFTTEITPGSKIQDPLFSDEGLEAGGRKLEVNWVNRPPFSVYSQSTTGSGVNGQSVYRVMYDKETPTDRDGTPNLYDELMKPGAKPIVRSFNIPVKVGADGKAEFTLVPAIDSLWLSGLDSEISEKELPDGLKKVESENPCTEVIMEVEGGKIVSVEMQK